MPPKYILIINTLIFTYVSGTLRKHGQTPCAGRHPPGGLLCWIARRNNLGMVNTVCHGILAFPVSILQDVLYAEKINSWGHFQSQKHVQIWSFMLMIVMSLDHLQKNVGLRGELLATCSRVWVYRMTLIKGGFSPSTQVPGQVISFLVVMVASVSPSHKITGTKQNLLFRAPYSLIIPSQEPWTLPCSVHESHILSNGPRNTPDARSLVTLVLLHWVENGPSSHRSSFTRAGSWPRPPQQCPSQCHFCPISCSWHFCLTASICWIYTHPKCIRPTSCGIAHIGSADTSRTGFGSSFLINIDLHYI